VEVLVKSPAERDLILAGNAGRSVRLRLQPT
jgi:hypothetical protein